VKRNSRGGGEEGEEREEEEEEREEAKEKRWEREAAIWADFRMKRLASG